MLTFVAEHSTASPSIIIKLDMIPISNFCPYQSVNTAPPESPYQMDVLLGRNLISPMFSNTVPKYLKAPGLLYFLKEKEKPKLIDIETLTFVAIHELAHIMTESIGHKKEFWENFKFLLQNAKDANIYNPRDFKKSPQNYCGMQIDDNPYFNM